MTFDFQPTLKGKLLELRALRASDFRDLYAVASDPLIWEQHPVKDRCKEDVFKVFFQGESVPCCRRTHRSTRHLQHDLEPVQLFVP
jgi:hypothetical protein